MGWGHKFSFSVLLTEENLFVYGLSVQAEDPTDRIIDKYDTSGNPEINPELREDFAKKRAMEKEARLKKKAAQEKARSAKEARRKRKSKLGKTGR